MYWRIPSQIKPDELRNYCEIIQQAIDKTLKIDEQTQEDQPIVEDRESSDDEDVFSKLRKLAKPKSPEAEEVNTQPSDEKEENVKEKSPSEAKPTEGKKKSRIQASTSDSEDDEDNAINSEAQKDSEAQKEEVIGDNENVNHSTSFRHALDSDEEVEENRKAIKRNRSASDSEPEKPKAKKGKIIESDEDD